MTSDDVAWLESRGARFNYVTNDTTGDDLIERERRDVRLLVAHAPAHVGVNGQKPGPHQYFPIFRFGHLGVNDTEVVQGGHPSRPAGEKELLVFHGRP